MKPNPIQVNSRCLVFRLLPTLCVAVTAVVAGPTPEMLAEGPYAFRPATHNSAGQATRWQAHHAAGDVHMIVGDDLSVFSHNGTALALEVAGVRREGQPMLTSGAVTGHRIEKDHAYIRRELIDEWIDNKPGGIKQSFLIRERSPGDGPLDLLVRVGGHLSISRVEATEVIFEDGAGHEVRYDNLAVFDAAGRKLAASFRHAGSDAFAMRIDDHDAVYPVCVDPLLRFTKTKSSSGSKGLGGDSISLDSGHTGTTVLIDRDICLVGVPTYDLKPTDGDIADKWVGFAATAGLQLGGTAVADGELDDGESNPRNKGRTSTKIDRKLMAQMLRLSLEGLGIIDTTVYDIGAVFVYRLHDGSWQLVDMVNDFGDSVSADNFAYQYADHAGARFGESLAMGDTHFIVGAPGYQHLEWYYTAPFIDPSWVFVSGPHRAGAVHFFRRPPPSGYDPLWMPDHFRAVSSDLPEHNQTGWVWTPNRRVYSRMGQKVAIEGDRAVVVSGPAFDPDYTLTRYDMPSPAKLHFFRLEGSGLQRRWKKRGDFSTFADFAVGTNFNYAKGISNEYIPQQDLAGIHIHGDKLFYVAQTYLDLVIGRYRAPGNDLWAEPSTWQGQQIPERQDIKLFKWMNHLGAAPTTGNSGLGRFQIVAGGEGDMVWAGVPELNRVVVVSRISEMAAGTLDPNSSFAHTITAAPGESEFGRYVVKSGNNLIIEYTKNGRSWITICKPSANGSWTRMLSQALDADLALQRATADRSSTNVEISELVDGITTHGGWAAFSSGTLPSTAVVEARDTITATTSTEFTFELSHPLGGQKALGRFRISATTDERANFADGLSSGGDVTANWTIMQMVSATGSPGETFQVLGDGSILAGGTMPSSTVYTIRARGISGNVTGFRLEALEDPSLPDNGPGRGTGGDWQLAEFAVSLGGEKRPVAMAADANNVVIQYPESAHVKAELALLPLDRQIGGVLRSPDGTPLSGIEVQLENVAYESELLTLNNGDTNANLYDTSGRILNQQLGASMGFFVPDSLDFSRAELLLDLEGVPQGQSGAELVIFPQLPYQSWSWYQSGSSDLATVNSHPGIGRGVLQIVNGMNEVTLFDDMANFLFFHQIDSAGYWELRIMPKGTPADRGWNPTVRSARLRLSGVLTPKVLRTDSAGHFHFGGLTAGQYLLRVNDSRWQGASEVLDLSRDAVLADQTLTASGQIPLRCFVRTDQGQPIAGATLRAGTIQAVTGADGSATLRGLSLGNYTVTVDPPYRAAAGAALTQAVNIQNSSPSDLYFTAQPQQNEARFRLVNSAGIGLGGIQVCVTGPFGFSRDFTSDASGWILFDRRTSGGSAGLYDGDYQLAPIGSGLAWRSGNVTLRLPQASGASWPTLSTYGSLAQVRVSHAGQPLSGQRMLALRVDRASVLVTRNFDNEWYHPSITSYSDVNEVMIGRFPGTQESPLSEIGSIWFQYLAADENPSKAFTLKNTTGIALLDSSMRRHQFSQSDVTSSYWSRVYNSPASDNKPGWRAEFHGWQGRVGVWPCEIVRSYDGWLVNQPVAPAVARGYSVRVVNELQRSEAVTDAMGLASFHDLAAGTYLFVPAAAGDPHEYQISRPLDWSYDRPYRTIASNESYLYDLSLRRMNRISGSVRAAGQPVGAATLRLVGGAGTPIATTLSDQEGNYEFKGIPSGRPASLTLIMANYGANGVIRDVRELLEARIANGVLEVPVLNANLGGDPLPNIAKTLYVRYEVDGVVHENTTAEFATMRIVGRPTEVLAVECTAAGYSFTPSTRPLDQLNRDRDAIDFQGSPSGVVTGRIVQSNGGGLANIPVRLSPQRVNASSSAAQRTQIPLPDGQVSLIYDIQVPSQGAIDDLSLNLTHREVEYIDLVHPDGTTIVIIPQYGRSFSNSHPYLGITYHDSHPALNFNWFSQTPSQLAPHQAFAALRGKPMGGTWRVRVGGFGGFGGATAGIPILSIQPMNLPEDRQVRISHTNPDGWYRFENIGPGLFSLASASSTYWLDTALPSADTTVAAGTPPVRTAAPPVVRVRVRDPSGTDVTGANLQWIGAAGIAATKLSGAGPTVLTRPDLSSGKVRPAMNDFYFEPAEVDVAAYTGTIPEIAFVRHAAITPSVSVSSPALRHPAIFDPTSLQTSTTVAGTLAYSLVNGAALAVGSHPVQWTFVPNIATQVKRATGTLALSVAKGTANITASGLQVVYDGTPKSPALFTEPVGLPTTITFAQGSTPTIPGTYAFTAEVNHADYEGSTSGSLVISPVGVQISVQGVVDGRLTRTYSPSGQSAPSATTIPPGINCRISYSTASGIPMTEAPDDAGNYLLNVAVDQEGHSGSTSLAYEIMPASVTWSISEAVDDEIARTYDPDGQAVPTIVSDPLNITPLITVTSQQEGLPSPVAGELPLASGLYQLSITSADPNYQGTGTWAFEIGKAPAVISNSEGINGIISRTYHPDGQSGLSWTTLPAGLPFDQVFTGTTHAGVAYGPSTEIPDEAGTYAVSVSVRDANYEGDATLALNLAKAATVLPAAQAPSGGWRAPGRLDLTALTSTTGDVDVAIRIAENSAVVASEVAGQPGMFDVYAAGTLTVEVTTDGNANWLPASRTHEIEIGKSTAAFVIESFPGSDGSATYSGAPISGPTSTTEPAGLLVRRSYSGTANDGTQLTDGTTEPPVKAGSYEVHCIIDDAAYQGEVTIPFTIRKAPATISFDGNPAIYDGTAKSPQLTTEPDGLRVNVTFANNTEVILPGVHAFTAIINEPNFEGSLAANLLLEKAPQTISWTTPESWSFGDGPLEIAATSSSGLPVRFHVIDGPAVIQDGKLVASGAGVVNLEFEQTGDERYLPITRQVQIPINKAQAAITLPSLLTATYTGSAPAFTATTSPPGLPVVISFPGRLVPPVNAGTYPIHWEISHADYQGSAEAEITIAKADAGITISNTQHVYSGLPRSATVSTQATDVETIVTYNGSVDLPTHAGTYRILVIASGLNHESSAESELAIARRAQNLTFALIPQVAFDDRIRESSMYAIPLTASSDSAGPSVGFTVLSGPGSIATMEDGTEGLAVWGAGEIIVRAFQPEDSNHLAAAPVDRELIVTKQSVGITLAASSKTHDGEPLAVSVISDDESRLSSTTARLTFNGSSDAPSDAGTYEVAVTCENEDYIGSASTIATIQKAYAAVTLSGLDVVWDGTSRSPVISTTPPSLPVTVTFTGSSSPPSDAGSHPFTLELDHPNYWTIGSGTLTIRPAPAVVSQTATSTIYTGETIPLPWITEPADLAIVTQIRRLDGSVIGQPAETIRDAGNYRISIRSGDPNRVIGTGVDPWTHLDFTVMPATAMATFGDHEFTYDGTPHLPSINKNPSSLEVNAEISDADGNPVDSAVNAGSYSMRITSADPNYQLDVTQPFTIAKAAPRIDFSLPDEMVYQRAPIALASSHTAGFPVRFSIVSGSAAIAPGGLLLQGVGEIVVQASADADPNHEATSGIATLNVLPAPLVVTWGDNDRVYHGSAQTVAYSADPADIDLSVNYDGQPSPPVEPGDYPVVITSADPRYTGSFQTTLSISRATVDFLADGFGTSAILQRTYSGQAVTAPAVSSSPAGLAPVITYRSGNDPESPTPPSAPGTHEMIVRIDTARYIGESVFTLEVVVPSVTLSTTELLQNSGFGRTYNGLPATAPIVITDPPGVPFSLRYQGLANNGSTYDSTTPPTHAGTYTLTVQALPPYQAEMTWPMVIHKGIPRYQLSRPQDLAPGGEFDLLSLVTTPDHLTVSVAQEQGPITAAGRLFGWGVTNAPSDGGFTVPAWPPERAEDASSIATTPDGGIASLSDGTVITWNPWESGTATEAGTDVVQVASAGSLRMALKADGTITTWGDAGHPASSIPPHIQQSVRAIALGDFHAIALLDDGRITAWGADDQGQATPPVGLVGLRVVQVAACQSASGAVTSDGRAWLWGSGPHSWWQGPDGVSLSNVRHLALGPTMGAAIQLDGRISPWGLINPFDLLAPDWVVHLRARSIFLGHQPHSWGDGYGYGQITLPDGRLESFGAILDSFSSWDGEVFVSNTNMAPGELSYGGYGYQTLRISGGTDHVLAVGSTRPNHRKLLNHGVVTIRYVIDESHDTVAHAVMHEFNTLAQDPGFQSWINAYPVAEQNTPSDDPDSDGISNLLEFILAGNPVESTAAVLPRLLQTPQGRVFAFKHRLAATMDYELIFQHSSNLVQWEDIPLDVGDPRVDVGQTDADGCAEIRVVMPTGITGSRFGRLRVRER